MGLRAAGTQVYPLCGHTAASAIPHPAQQVTTAGEGAGGISEQHMWGCGLFHVTHLSLSDLGESLVVLPCMMPCPHRDVLTGTVTQQQPLCVQRVAVLPAPTPTTHMGSQRPLESVPMLWAEHPWASWAMGTKAGPQCAGCRRCSNRGRLAMAVSR